MKYGLAVFDLDGTVLNTLFDLYKATDYALFENGFDKRSEDEVRRFVGNGIHKLIERAVPENASSEDVERVFKSFNEYYSVHCADNTKPYDGIPSVLTLLRQKGIKTAVVSNKADYAVQSLCKKYFDGLFDFCVGERAGIKRKPAPDSVNEVLKTLGFSKENAVYIGDSDVDILTAKNSGIPCRSVCWGFRSEEELCRAGAKTVYRTPEELYRALTADG